MTVGQVGVPVREGLVKGGRGKVTGEVEVHARERDQTVVRELVQTYRSNGNDVKWARSGVLAKVIDREAITVVQNRVEDAGFGDLDIIRLGADRVFLRSMSDKETSSLLEDAKDFFGLIFSNIVRWDKEVVPFRRGAWLRLYGIPILAWNENLFKLCVFECGTYLRTDDMTLDRGRFDYARVLVLTPSLDMFLVLRN